MPKPANIANQHQQGNKNKQNTPPQKKQQQPKNQPTNQQTKTKHKTTTQDKPNSDRAYTPNHPQTPQV